MTIITGRFHARTVAVLLASLLLSSVSLLGAAVIAQPGDGAQTFQQEANPVALVSHFFVLAVFGAAMYLSHRPIQVSKRALHFPSHTYRGPPISHGTIYFL